MEVCVANSFLNVVLSSFNEIISVFFGHNFRNLSFAFINFHLY